MDEYISREAVNDNSNIITVQTKEYGSIEVIPIDTIADIESADVQPVKHGKWKHVAGMNSKCSVCSHYFPVTEFDSRPFDINYCPNCGARMDIIYEDDKVRAIKVTGWGNYCGECDAKMDGDKE